MNWVMKMEKIKVDQNICIGCGACFGSYPDCFEMDDNVYAIPFADVSKAKILITDALLQEFADAQENSDLQ